jgi:hypothetical protein
VSQLNLVNWYSDSLLCSHTHCLISAPSLLSTVSFIISSTYHTTHYQETSQNPTPSRPTPHTLTQQTTKPLSKLISTLSNPTPHPYTMFLQLLQIPRQDSKRPETMPSNMIYPIHDGTAFGFGAGYACLASVERRRLGFGK